MLLMFELNLSVWLEALTDVLPAFWYKCVKADGVYLEWWIFMASQCSFLFSGRRRKNSNLFENQPAMLSSRVGKDSDDIGS